MIQKHTHKLKKHQYKTGNWIFFCILPDCNFKIDAALALGKKCLCNQCNAEMTLNDYQLKLKRPHCDACSKRKIKGPDGKNHYIRNYSSPIISSVAEENLSTLVDRLANITRNTEEEDL